MRPTNAIKWPIDLKEYLDDQNQKTQIQDAITAARSKCAMPPHMLFTGVTDPGKSSIASVIARLLNVPMLRFLGKELTSQSQLSRLLEFPEYGGILFLDEIHGVPTAIVELLSHIMDDQTMTAAGDTGLVLYLNPVMVIGTTSVPGVLAKPLVDRFTIKATLRPNPGRLAALPGH